MVAPAGGARSAYAVKGEDRGQQVVRLPMFAAAGYPQQRQRPRRMTFSRCRKPRVSMPEYGPTGLK